ncbi:zinc knuckle [Colletotrichum acutatum]
MHKMASFRETSQASQLRGLHQLARLIRPDESVCQTDDESLHCFKDKIWPKSSDATDPPAPEVPELDPKRPQLFTPQCISDEELHEAFTSVERGKAAGPDDIINNALKVGWAEIYKYFKHLVNASFKTFHHHLCYRDATTIVVPKPDKEDYAQPKAYRSIALLSCIGKLLQRLVAARLQILAVQHKFLPNRQFACVGRSTTEALEHIFNLVYKAWSLENKGRCKRRTTMCSSDISGAYDHVDRQALPHILVELGVPDWLVKWIASFLSLRRSQLRAPGHTSDWFYVNIGIPQIEPIALYLRRVGMAHRASNFDTAEGQALKSVRDKLPPGKLSFSHMDRNPYQVQYNRAIEFRQYVKNELSEEQVAKWEGARRVMEKDVKRWTKLVTHEMFAELWSEYQ